MLKLRNVILGFAIFLLCFFTCPSPESRAADRSFFENVIGQTDSATTFSLIKERIHLAKAGKEGKRGQNETWMHVESSASRYSGEETTKVIIRGNSVLVPVTLVHDNNEVDVRLVLDTGAARTTIHAYIADKLSVNLNETKKTKVMVVGGGIIDARIVRINSLTVGPHTSRDWNVFVVSHHGFAAKYDGLLGMDVLRELKYRIDFKRQIIIWE